MIYSHVESFHNKTRFYSNFKKFWVLQNFFPTVEKISKINCKNKAKTISTFDFNTLPTFISHNQSFAISHSVFKQDIGIPMGINLAPFSANLFLISS